MQGILSDQAIRTSLAAGDLALDPFDDALINPASVDLTLGTGFAVYERWVDPAAFHEVPASSQDLPAYIPVDQYLDVRDPPKVLRYEMTPEAGWVLRPNILYLMHTAEVLTVGRKHVAVVDGKSSIGRLGILVHVTAGYIDPGFSGQVTLEVVVTHPIRVYPGMRFCQVRFHTLAGELDAPYEEVGHYTGSLARGAVPSQAWRQFKR